VKVCQGVRDFNDMPVRLFSKKQTAVIKIISTDWNIFRITS
jgi:hypothetical protein